MKISQITVQIDTDKPTETYYLAHTGKVAPDGMLRLGLDEEHTGWVGSVFVNEDARGKGVATALLEQVIADCRQAGKQFVSLTVADKNEGAQRLYKRLGFVPFMKGTEGYMQYLKTL